jgi:hypothetical protein
VTCQRLVERHYPDGASYPVEIYASSDAAKQFAEAAAGVDGVAETAGVETSPGGRWSRISAILAAGPDSERAKETVECLREAVDRVPTAEALVGRLDVVTGPARSFEAGAPAALPCASRGDSEPLSEPCRDCAYAGRAPRVPAIRLARCEEVEVAGEDALGFARTVASLDVAHEPVGLEAIAANDAPRQNSLLDRRDRCRK